MRTDPDPKDDGAPDPDLPLTERVREDIGELAQRAAQEMIDEADERERREQNRRHTPTPTEQEVFYCLVHYRVDLSVGRSWYEAETIDPMPHGLRPLRTIAETPEKAIRRMHWVYAQALSRLVYHSEEWALKKAARATFIQAEVIR